MTFPWLTVLWVLPLVGSVLVTASWAIFSGANTLGTFYLGGLVGGIGAGMVYITSVGNALKWFSDRRGFAAGVTAGARWRPGCGSTARR